MNPSATKFSPRDGIGRLSAFLLLPLILLGCGEAPAPTQTAGSPRAAVLRGAPPDDLLKAVRQATARFHSMALAGEAGYQETQDCVPGMGYHWVNPSLVDPVFDPLHPEVMLYAPGPSGRPKLVAVEYIVIDAGQPRPSFGDHPFDLGGTPLPVPHWSLHVWLYTDNPDGILTANSPAVSCSQESEFRT